MTRLLLDGDRKSIEPIAGRVVDRLAERDAMRQRLQQVVCVAPWDEALLFESLAVKLEGELPGVEALVVDDIGFPKKRKHSVGVARQNSGTLGRIDNCQVGVSLHLAGEQGSGCIGLRLYMPESWIADRHQCEKAGVPADVQQQKKWEIDVAQIENAINWGVRRHSVLANAGYENSTEFRAALNRLGLPYLVAVSGSHKVYAPGTVPQVPALKATGRPPLRQVSETAPKAITEVACDLAYRKVT